MSSIFVGKKNCPVVQLATRLTLDQKTSGSNPDRAAILEVKPQELV